jgi:hypothetical protein
VLDPHDIITIIDYFIEVSRKIASPHFDKYERIIGLRTAHTDFRGAVVKAIAICAWEHGITPYHRRASHIAKNLERAHKSAKAACNHLRCLQEALDDLPSPVGAVFDKARGLRGEIARRSLDATIAWLDRESDLTRLGAEQFKDRGGRPKILAFELLTKGLADAFKIGTGRRAWNDVKGQWEASFLKLVEAVLPEVESITAAHPERLGKPLSPSALRQYLRRLRTRAQNNREGRVQKGSDTKPHSI